MCPSSRGNSRGSRPYHNHGGRGRSQGRGYGHGNRISCQLCGKIGHTVQKRYHCFDVHFEGLGPQDESNNASNVHNPNAGLRSSTK